ncbi:MAG: Rrf2 family transcriptional regulator [Coriobacteriia bacterium]|nr:Rrf2 family transcriptional regulator [Coriobacteriia bacterium]MDR2714635.1 Rrf2 family transcriptional regulator [Coriobacteriales bacterium]
MKRRTRSIKTSSKARYALYLVVDIARTQAGGPVSLRTIAERQDISLKYLEQIATELCKSGYLQSVRGAQGGYLLARPATEITAGNIMRAAEGGFLPVSCLDTAIGSECSCPRQSQCGSTAGFWAGLRSTIDDYIDGVSIEQLAR